MQVVVTFNWQSNVEKMKSVALSKSTSIDDCCVSMANFAEFAFTSIIVITLHYLLLLRFVRCRRPYCSDSYYHCYWHSYYYCCWYCHFYHFYAYLYLLILICCSTRFLCHNQHFSIFAKAGSQAGHYCNRLPCMDIQYIECPCIAFGCSRCSHAHMPTTRRYSCDLFSASIVPDCTQPTHNDSIATT